MRHPVSPLDGEPRVHAPSDGLRNLRIDLAYDGTAFHGWQAQPGVRTVQGEIESALERVLGERVRVAGASRTDAGVHARGQVASVTTHSVIPAAELARALEALTGDDLSVVRVADISPAFHARFSTIAKHYRYRLRRTPLPSPFDRAYSWHVPGKLDLDAMRASCAPLVGKHDFTSFQGAGSEVASAVRALTRLELVAGDEHLDFHLEGDGFLRHMVRNIVGTLAEVGLGRRSPGSVSETLAARDRAAAGPTAPARGLTLERVFYPEIFEHQRGT